MPETRARPSALPVAAASEASAAAATSAASVDAGSTLPAGVPSLELEGVPKGGRVAVAMSGGVDSAVAAVWLRHAGYEVIGLTMRLYGDAPTATAPTRRTSKTCCAGQDIHDAKRVAAAYAIPHYVLDYESQFRNRVIDDFTQTYQRGQTPIPCVRCNQYLKFESLLTFAQQIGAACLVTGHYVRRLRQGHETWLARGVDGDKDQAWFLFATTLAQLSYLRFPLGELRKTQTRALARAFGLGVAEKKDSQDICFVPNGAYGDLLRRLHPDALEGGAILDQEGRVLGSHAGVAHYTVGQRKRLGLGGRHGASETQPLYVVALDPVRRHVIVGPREALARRELQLEAVNWLARAPAVGSFDVQYRSSMTPVRASLDGTRVRFEEPQYGIAPGQACVFFDKERVLGGGWIQAS